MSDVVLAQQVVSGMKYNFGNEEMFHDTSAVYKISNERIQDYHKFLTNKKRMLSVIASGDQILCGILEGTEEIDAFDISRFPKYFLYLKIAGIQALSREEYIDFFYGCCNRDEIYEDMYDSIRVYLDGDVLDFWDGLLNFFEWREVYNSTLFSSEPYIERTAITQNKYLQSDEEYNKLRQVISNVVIRTHEGDILDISGEFNVPYDIVYLSNIVYYVNKERYKKALEELPLSEQGMVLTYMYKIQDQAIEYFQSDHVYFEKFKNSDSGVMIYHK